MLGLFEHIELHIRRTRLTTVILVGVVEVTDQCQHIGEKAGDHTDRQQRRGQWADLGDQQQREDNLPHLLRLLEACPP